MLLSEKLSVLFSQSSAEATGSIDNFTSRVYLSSEIVGVNEKGGSFELFGSSSYSDYIKQTGITFNLFDYNLDVSSDALFKVVFWDEGGGSISEPINIYIDNDDNAVLEIGRSDDSYLGFYGNIPVAKQEIDISSGGIHDHLEAIGNALHNLGLITFLT
jgi:hypothetical protein